MAAIYVVQLTSKLVNIAECSVGEEVSVVVSSPAARTTATKNISIPAAIQPQQRAATLSVIKGLSTSVLRPMFGGIFKICVEVRRRQFSSSGNTHRCDVMTPGPRLCS